MGCTTGNEEQQAQPSAEAPTSSAPESPQPSATPHEPVEGKAKITLRRVNRPANKMFASAESTRPKRGAARRLGREVRDWLDAHLTQLQEGDERGLLTSGLLDDRAGPRVAAVTTDLSAPEQPVQRARYAIRVTLVGGPLWARARVMTRDDQGDKHRATFVFMPADNGLRVMAAGPRERQ